MSLPIDPFVSNHYHFGMRLSLADLETEQGYHRGKAWLHNAWLHGAGTVWGLGVLVSPPDGTVIVRPGLALDRLGREVRVAEPIRLDLPRWYGERRREELQVEQDDDVVRFRVHVTLCAEHCLERPVPAISEPRSGGAQVDTAYSRTVERAVAELAPNAAPGPDTTDYPRLRQFAGQLPATDAAVLAAQAAVAAAAEPERPAVHLDWMRRLAALDTVDLVPAGGPEDPFPVEDGGRVVLAEIAAHLRRDVDRWVVVTDGASPTTVDNTVRTAHVRTGVLQELLRPAPGRAPRP